MPRRNLAGVGIAWWAALVLGVPIVAFGLSVPLAHHFDSSATERAFLRRQIASMLAGVDRDRKAYEEFTTAQLALLKRLRAEHASESDINLVLKSINGYQSPDTSSVINSDVLLLQTLTAESSSTRWAVTGVLAAVGIALWGALISIKMQRQQAKDARRLHADVNALSEHLDAWAIGNVGPTSDTALATPIPLRSEGEDSP